MINVLVEILSGGELPAGSVVLLPDSLYKGVITTFQSQPKYYVGPRGMPTIRGYEIGSVDMLRGED